MTDLGQQQLLEPDKPRSIIVPAGCGSWWGVDASTRACAIGVARPDSIVVASVDFPQLDALARLSLIYEDARALAERLAGREGCAPGMIGVEQPSGSTKAVSHELEFAVGVTIAGIYDGVKAVVGPVQMQLVVGSWWKLRACGNGAIRKTKKVPGRSRPVRLTLEEYPVMQWARLNGYRGKSWDEADAMGIAVAMRADVDLVQR